MVFGQVLVVAGTDGTGTDPNYCFFSLRPGSVVYSVRHLDTDTEYGRVLKPTSNPNGYIDLAVSDVVPIVVAGADYSNYMLAGNADYAFQIKSDPDDYSRYIVYFFIP